MTGTNKIGAFMIEGTKFEDPTLIKELLETGEVVAAYDIHCPLSVVLEAR